MTSLNKELLEHELVPMHEILEQKQVVELLKKYNATVNQLPKIRADDPIALAIKARKGNVLKITRKSPTAGESIYYRVVV